ncbi:MAG TPA: right-handed parallel beta-helix repeat-containing protein [Candidatus Eisenbacteria bacterium]|nr:right-handed parallel beta-helix repeat-containing protein [Candidatus Eisenbacteria bacterium]
MPRRIERLRAGSRLVRRVGFWCAAALLVAAPALLVAAPAMAANTATFRWRMDGDTEPKTIAPVNRANVQAVLDQARRGRDLYIDQGPGNLDADSTLWIHGNTHWTGAGQGLSTVTRTRFNPADPAYHGDIVNSARWGMHAPNLGLTGDAPTDSLESITIQGITLDGNGRSWADADPNGCNNFGIQIWFAEGVSIRDVEVKNTLQTGIELDACRRSRIADSWIHDVGLQTNLGTRNGINLNNNSGNLAASLRWARDLSVTNTRIDNHRDTMIDCANVSDVTIDGIRSHCDFDSVSNRPGQALKDVFEFEGSIRGYTMRKFTISNIAAQGQTGVFFVKSGSAPPLDGLTMTHLEFTAGDSSFGACIALGSNPGGVHNVRIEDGTFRNLNGKNSGVGRTSTFLYCYSDRDTIRDVVFKDLTFVGAHGETYHPSNRGAQIGGNATDVRLEDCTFRNCEAEGVAVLANGSNVARRIVVERCVVDGSQREGFIVQQSGVSGKVNGVRFSGNVAKETNKNRPGFAFRALATSGDVRNVSFLRNQVVRTSGADVRGLQLYQSGGAALDSIWVAGNDLGPPGTAPYSSSGKVTNVRLTDPAAAP